MAFPSGRVVPGDLDSLEYTTRRLLETPPEVDPPAFPTVREMVDRTLSLYRELTA